MSRAPSLWQGRLVFGAHDDTVYCLDAATGALLWSVYEPGSIPTMGQVVDSQGIVYYGGLGKIWARDVRDGSVVWSTGENIITTSAPSLVESEGRFYIGQSSGGWRCRRTSDGELIWTSWVSGGSTSPVDSGRVYVGSGHYLYCLDAATGSVIWRFWERAAMLNSVAVGHDGTTYSGTSSVGLFYAVNPDGSEKWRFDFERSYVMLSAPIVGGDGTIYVSTVHGVARLGRVYAIKPDGTLLWQYDFPTQTFASPTLGPDGTLYILCSDKYLYAFRDWERAAPTGLTVLRGLALSGGLPDLTESDDSRLVVRPWFVLTTQEAPVQVVVESTSPIPDPRKILFTLEASASIPNIGQKIELFNYVTGRWETVDSHPATTADSIAEIVITKNPERFIQPLTLAMKAKISYKEAGPILLYPWQARLDHVFWTVYHSPGGG